MKDLRGKRVLVVGLARSGYAVALCLRRHGAVVTVTDIRPPHAFQAILPELLAQKIGLELGSQRAETFLRHDLVVISPGVPWDLPQLRAAREQGIPVVPEVEAASWFLEGTLVGVTGSNGKTTTASLLGKILEASGFPTFVGGNIGVPLSTAVDHVESGSFLVAELSSFQLEAIRDFRPHVAIFLNLSPNHLDRHPSLEAYVQAKRQIFRNQQADDYAILNLDDPAVAALAPALAGRKVFFSRRRQLPDGVFVSNGHVIYRVGHLERVLFATCDVGLRGNFNLEDVLAAAAAACVLGADFDGLRSALRGFRGVEHRLEFVRAIGGVEFYNNSKATSVDAAAKSLEAFERGVHLILGGKDKGAPYAPLRPLLPQRVREVLLIGQAAERIAKELSGAAELVHAGDLETAVREAFRRAEPGDTVLLAPACSSFDQFQDFEHRGRVFKELVNDLAREAEAEPAKWRKADPVAAAVPAPQSVSRRIAEPEAPAVSAETPAPARRRVVESLPSPTDASGLATEPVQPAEVTPEVIPEPAEIPSEPATLEAAPERQEETSEPPVVLASEPAPTEEAVAAQSRRRGIVEPTEAESEPPVVPMQAATEVMAPEPAPEEVAEPGPEGASPEELPLGGAPPSAAAATAGGAEAQPPPSPSRLLELVYVYEVGAEEQPPADLEFPPQFVDETPPEAPEATEDEPLPFEARQGAVAAVGAEQAVGLAESGSGPGDALSSLPALAGQKPGEAGLGEGKGDSPDATRGEAAPRPYSAGPSGDGAPQDGPVPEGPGDAETAKSSGPQGGQSRLPGIE